MKKIVHCRIGFDFKNMILLACSLFLLYSNSAFAKAGSKGCYETHLPYVSKANAIMNISKDFRACIDNAEVVRKICNNWDVCCSQSSKTGKCSKEIIKGGEICKYNVEQIKGFCYDSCLNKDHDPILQCNPKVYSNY